MKNKKNRIEKRKRITKINWKNIFEQLQCPTHNHVLLQWETQYTPLFYPCANTTSNVDASLMLMILVLR